MTLRKGVCHRENQTIHRKFQHLFKADHLRPCTVPVGERPCVLACLCSWSTGLTLSTCICNNVHYRGVGQRIHGKSSLWIICTEIWCSYLGHASDVQGKTKEKYK